MGIRYPVWIEVNCWKSLFAWIIKFLYGLNCVAESKLTYFELSNIGIWSELPFRVKNSHTSWVFEFRYLASIGLKSENHFYYEFSNFDIWFELRCRVKNHLELRRLNWDESQIIRYPITLIHRFIGSNRLIVKKRAKK